MSTESDSESEDSDTTQLALGFKIKLIYILAQIQNTRQTEIFPPKKISFWLNLQTPFFYFFISCIFLFFMIYNDNEIIFKIS